MLTRTSRFRTDRGDNQLLGADSGCRNRLSVVATARVDGLLPTVARELDLEITALPGGGEFGAALARDSHGRELVLKVLPGSIWAARFARGAELSARVRSSSYPVPRYFGTGVAVGASWSLQERLPGTIPDVMTESHARQLLGFLNHHEESADGDGDLVSEFRQELGDAVARLVDQPAIASLAAELGATMASAPTIAVRSHDVVHGDFHHRNFLAEGDRVTGVFDWELAWVGDWRVDLVNLACWGSWVPSQIPPDVVAVIVEAARSACEPPVLALFAAFHTLRALEFNLRVHPDRLPWMLDVIDATTRAWLRPS
ncbi:MAG: aminoglycoside phosphotransferase family protein [Actinobacteria bacterium]|nr:MAG: aminoglycoside phosphotransferase family protein [Actinomycetota bacterium]